MRVLLAVVLIASPCAFAIRHKAAHKVHARSFHRSRWRKLMFWNPLFRPSHESLLRQNAEIDRLELPRIQNEEELEQFKADGDLVPILASESLRFDPRLSDDRRFCRPWTRDFLDDLSAAYYKEFHDQIQVNSAVRTVVIQKKLRRHNRNAAPESGDTASSHLAGITVDLQRRGMSKARVKWVEQYLLPLRDQGLIEPEEERHQWVFHIAVSGNYAEYHQAKLLAANPSAARPILREAAAKPAATSAQPALPQTVAVHKSDSPAEDAPLLEENTGTDETEHNAAPASTTAAPKSGESSDSTSSSQ